MNSRPLSFSKGTDCMIDSYYNSHTGASRHWNHHTQTMPREKLDALHLHRIQLLIKHAYENTSFYRRLYDQAGMKPEDIRTWDDFYRRVPFTDKPDLIQDQEAKPFAAQAIPPAPF